MEVKGILYYIIFIILIIIALAIVSREIRIESTARFYVRVKKRMSELEKEEK